ncbi:hypothetical protein [Williamsia sp. CHRR-6]|uniref:hypothetical protein n=1 Tax=Williamsia sp. CHRR-6 TaxID=2835871 RepID=UPI001BDB0406|nr:hypothetical protein [Williamsia sp. CHRR-6]MBT0568168.1 hypothetical protein [Williamsia sp. CHRR-6]
MEIIATRQRKQPAPAWVVFDDLSNPNRTSGREWLHLLDDEIAPRILQFHRPDTVTWSSIWIKRPDARSVFELSDAGGETALRWSLLVIPPTPEEQLFRNMCQRIGELINANLRYTYGQ